MMLVLHNPVKYQFGVIVDQGNLSFVDNQEFSVLKSISSRYGEWEILKEEISTGTT